MEFISKIVEINEGDTKIRLQMWDTAGSERYRAMTTNHYRSAVGALLVYDISNEESFNNLGYWLEELRKNLDPSALIALCANKVARPRGERAKSNLVLFMRLLNASCLQVFQNHIDEIRFIAVGRCTFSRAVDKLIVFVDS